MEFKILGPLEVVVGSRRLDLGGARQQVVLATLLLSANTVVTVSRLQEAIYGEDLPPTSRSQAQISISSLRRLFAACGHPTTISTRAYGYVIDVGSGQLDSQRFDQLTAAARSARDAGQFDLAVAGYRDALRLWRGPALDGIDSQLLQAAAGRLDEQRIATNEERLTLELDLGRHHELVGELTELTGEHPLRERLRGQLMLALYRCGRTAEALAVYRQTRQTMIDELGIEPSGWLRQLQQAILTSDAAIELQPDPVRIQPARQQAPGLLPADIADFIDRVEQIDQIHRRLVPAPGEESRLAVPVVAIVGKGGVGKTSVAVHAAHGLIGHFADGQLFADLHGGAANPVSPAQVLERFLRALGVPGSQIPEGLDERAEMYRNLISGRRVLVVLDDAAGESQVSPLLPGSGVAAVMLTSRSRLAGLGGATHIEVNVFDQVQSLDLLGRIAGSDRVHAQSQAAVAVAERCGHLPLALRIAGARLAARPHWSAQHLADRLADETRRLDELRHGDMGVRASISLTYESSSEQARRLLRRLALLELPVFSGWVSAPLLDLPPGGADEVLDELVHAQLVEATGTGKGLAGQYRLHELIRVFARERLLAEEPATDRQAALARALGALLYLAEHAYRRFYGGDHFRLESEALRWPLPDQLVERIVADPLLWADQERAALVSGIRQAAQAGLVELSWKLTILAGTFFEARAYFDDWRETVDISLQAARRARDVRGEAAMRYMSGTLNLEQSRYDQARTDLDAAARLFGDVGDEQGVALVIRHIANLDRLGGRFDEAIDGYEKALVILRRTGEHVATTHALESMARIKVDLGDLDAASELLTEALALVKAAPGLRRLESQVLFLTGEVQLQAGDPASAASTLEGALAIVRAIADPVGEAHILRAIGVAKLRQGELDASRAALQRALDLSGEARQRLTEAAVLRGLSELAVACGDYAEAAVFARRAADVFHEIGAAFYEADALTLLSDMYAALGDHAAAAQASQAAAAIRSKLTGTAQSS